MILSLCLLCVLFALTTFALMLVLLKRFNALNLGWGCSDMTVFSFGHEIGYDLNDGYYYLDLFFLHFEISYRLPFFRRDSYLVFRVEVS